MGPPFVALSDASLARTVLTFLDQMAEEGKKKERTFSSARPVGFAAGAKSFKSAQICGVSYLAVKVLLNERGSIQNINTVFSHQRKG